MNDTGKAVLAMVVACVIWGLSGIYYKLLSHVPPLEVLSHRTIWSLVFFGLVLAVQGRLGELKRLILSRRVGRVALAAAAISLNWGMFIFSIQTGHALPASLGYYIFPLVAVALGVMIFGETLGRAKALAIALAAIAVTVLSLGLGVAPWIPLWLAITFGIYGVIKKGLDAGPIATVTGEVLLLSPLALIWLIGVHSQGWTGLTGTSLGTFGHSLHDSLLLMFSGVLTGLPLILFSSASRKLPYGTVGVLQYINPTLQFLVAALIFGEEVTIWHMIALPLIWLALAIYSTQTFRQERALRKRATSAGTSGTTVT